MRCCARRHGCWGRNEVEAVENVGKAAENGEENGAENGAEQEDEKIDCNFVIYQSKKTCYITMKTAEYESQCPLCEDKIIEGDNIEYCHVRREWHHLVCPWRNDEGYRPDMVILDADDDDEIITIMDHEKNKMKDRYLRVINEKQTSGEESQEYKITKEGSWFEKLWKSVGDFFKF